MERCRGCLMFGRTHMAGCSFFAACAGRNSFPAHPLAVVVSRKAGIGSERPAYIRSLRRWAESRIVLPSKLRSLDSLREKLILAVPLRTASGLSAAQAPVAAPGRKGSTLISEAHTLSERMGSRPECPQGLPDRGTSVPGCACFFGTAPWSSAATAEGRWCLPDVGPGFRWLHSSARNGAVFYWLPNWIQRRRGIRPLSVFTAALLRAGSVFPSVRASSALFDYADRVAADPHLWHKMARAGIRRYMRDMGLL